MPADIFVLGSFVVDVAFRSARPPQPGETLIGSSFVLGPGGKGSNQAVAAARAGARVSLMTSIGADAFGQVGRDLWRAEGIDTTYLKTSVRPTGCAAILVDETSGENAIIVVPSACDTLAPEDVDNAQQAITSGRVFLAQLELPLPTIQRGLALAHAAGMITILNPAPAQPLPPELLQHVDYLIPNETEAALLAALPNPPEDSGDLPQATAAALLKAGCRNIVLTLGANGALLGSQAGQFMAIPAFSPSAVVDTTGAGDAFCGAFAAALAQDRPPEQAARFAAVAAGLSVARHGTAPAMASREEIEAALGRLS